MAEMEKQEKLDQLVSLVQLAQGESLENPNLMEGIFCALLLPIQLLGTFYLTWFL